MTERRFYKVKVVIEDGEMFEGLYTGHTLDRMKEDALELVSLPASKTAQSGDEADDTERKESK